ncbi:MAG TPA: hypothetical protein VFY29_15965 [Terriglobia bacterium]|nr:hypothetical protein [Terriglobia bacterium]
MRSSKLSRRSMLQVIAAGSGAMALEPLLRAQSAAPMDAVTARIKADMEKHASFGIKRSATPGDIQTAQWIASRLKTAGYKVESPEFPSPFFVERAVSLSTGGMTLNLYPQTPAATTGPKGVTGRLALIRTKADAAATSGKIAFLVLNSGRHAALGRDNNGIGGTIRAAASAGALGVVIVTTGPSGEAVLLNAPVEQRMPVPVAVMAPKDSAPFQEAAAKGAEATFVLDGDATERNGVNVVGRLTRGPKWIVISTPRSGWFSCVGERGTGTSVFLELAEWAIDRFPNHSIHLVNAGAHEYYFAGSHKVMDLAPPPQSTDIWAHIGATLAARDADESGGKLRMLDTADPQRSLMATTNLNAAVAEGFRGISELERARPVRADAGELSVFTERGYSRCFAVLGLHRWLHTIEDTLERVDARLVTPVLEAHKRTIERGVAEA